MVSRSIKFAMMLGCLTWLSHGVQGVVGQDAIKPSVEQKRVMVALKQLQQLATSFANQNHGRFPRHWEELVGSNSVAQKSLDILSSRKPVYLGKGSIKFHGLPEPKVAVHSNTRNSASPSPPRSEPRNPVSARGLAEQVADQLSRRDPTLSSPPPKAKVSKPKASLPRRTQQQEAARRRQALTLQAKDRWTLYSRAMPLAAVPATDKSWHWVIYLDGHIQRVGDAKYKQLEIRKGLRAANNTSSGENGSQKTKRPQSIIGQMQLKLEKRIAEDRSDRIQTNDHRQVISIDASGMDISDADLSLVKGYKFLIMLDLSGTNITGLGLQHLHGLAKLKKLMLKDTRTTPRDLAALRRAIPELEIQP